MADNQNGASSASFPAAPGAYGTMSDVQLRQAISNITSAAQATYASPAPRPADPKAYMKNVHTWSTATTPPPKTPASAARNSRPRTTRTSALAPTTAYTPPVYTSNLPMPVPVAQPNPPRPPLPTTPQAMQSSYSSRLRTGVSLLMQPIIASSSTNPSRSTRRGGVVNYADPGSGDEFPDAGAIDSDDSDFIASGGTRTAIRQSRTRMGAGMSTFSSTAAASSTPNRVGTPQVMERNELDQSYLGQIPPTKFIKPRPIKQPTAHEYPSPDVMLSQAHRRTSLIPVRVEFETETHRVRDCFVWNVNEEIIKPEIFAKIFCHDMDLPLTFADTIATQIRAQIEEHEGVAGMDLGQDGAPDYDDLSPQGDEFPECRVILSIDVQIANHHLMDHIEWDLLSPLTPEVFAQKLCMELGLSGEAIPLVAHAVHEEILKHKKDAIEWGVIGGEREVAEEAGDKPREKVGFGMVKDKTGLGLGWGRAPKDGWGPKTLKSVWRDWQEAEEFRTKFEELTAEEVERREIERERASRRLRRETSKFQSTRSRRR